MTTHAELSPKPSTGPIRSAALVICALCALTTLPWIYMSIGQFGGFAWGLFGFELVVLLGCLMTIFVCLGKIRVGMAFPMAMACLIGTILVAAVFGLYVDARAVVGDHPTIHPWVMKTLMFRISIILLLSVLATLDVYRRDPRSWGLIIRAVLFVIPVVALGAWIKVKGLPMSGNGSGEPSSVRMVVYALSGLGIGILLSIGGHFLIRSYEIAFSEPKLDTEPEKTGKA